MAMSEPMRKAILLIQAEGKPPTERLYSAMVAHGYITVGVTAEALEAAKPQVKRAPEPAPHDFESARAYYLRKLVFGSGDWTTLPIPASVEASLVESRDIEVNAEGESRATASGHKRVTG